MSTTTDGADFPLDVTYPPPGRVQLPALYRSLLYYLPARSLTIVNHKVSERSETPDL